MSTSRTLAGRTRSIGRAIACALTCFVLIVDSHPQTREGSNAGSQSVSVSDATPPHTLESYRDRPDHELFLGLVRDVWRSSVNMNKVPAEVVRVECLKTSWKNGDLNGVPEGQSAQIILVPRFHPACGQLGAIRRDTTYWFVIKNQGYGNPPTTIEYAVAGVDLSDRAFMKYDRVTAPLPEELKVFLQNENVVVALCRIRDIEQHVRRENRRLLRVDTFHCEIYDVFARDGAAAGALDDDRMVLATRDTSKRRPEDVDPLFGVYWCVMSDGNAIGTREIVAMCRYVEPDGSK